MSKILLVLGLILSGAISSAGIRDGGTGGGFAEIQFVYYFQNTKHLIQFCLENTSTCRLTSEQQVKWSELLKQVNTLNEQYTVGFVSDSSKKWYLQGQNIFVQQTNLYGEQDQEIPEPQILALALSIQLSLSQRLTDDFEKTLAETQVNLSQLEFQNKKIGFSVTDNSIYFHQLKIVINEKSLTLLALEDKMNSYPLNSLIKRLHPDLDVNRSNFTQIIGGQTGSSGLFFGYLNETRKFKINFKLDHQNNIIQDSIEVKIALEK